MFLNTNFEEYYFAQDAPIRLHLNEFDFPHTPNLNKKLSKLIKEDSRVITNYYSNERTKKLIDHVSKFNKVNAENVLLTNGGDSSLETLLFGSHDKKATVFPPSYGYYKKVCKLNNCNYNEDTFDQCDWEKSDMYFICSPNNPNGTVFNISKIEPLLRLFPNKKFIIDETYIDFQLLLNDHSNTNNPLIETYENIFIVKSFSKAFGMAGMRLGYILSHKNNMRQLNTIYNKKNVTELTKQCGVLIMEDIKYYKKKAKEMYINKANIIRALIHANIKYIDTPANFICVYVGAGDKVKKFMSLAKNSGFLFRDISDRKSMSGYVRVSMGNTETTDKLIKFINNLNSRLAL